MTTFDFTQVREFADGLNAKLDQCDHGEGNACATVEKSLELYAVCCCDFYRRVRQWHSDVFYGRVAFDPTTEQTWRAELERLYARALGLADVVRQLEPHCYKLDEKCALESAVWYLSRLRDEWVTPQLAVGPSARRQLNPKAAEDARQRLRSLAPLPKDWEPAYPDQKRLFHRVRSERLKAKND